MDKYITAKELAEELLKNPDDIVCKTTDNFEQGHNTIPIRSIHLYRSKGEVVKEDFRDAFDGGSYTSSVIRMSNEGKLNFVKI